MFDPMDFFRKAASPEAMAEMAQRFGLSPLQTQQAFAAVMPAFALGLQQLIKKPESMTDIMGKMAGEQKGAFDKGVEAGGSAVDAGQEIMARMFGSSEVASRIAETAATASGVAAGIMEKMMPALAGMAVAATPKPAAQPANPFEAMFAAAAKAGESLTAVGKGPASMLEAWSSMMKTAFGQVAGSPGSDAAKSGQELLAATMNAGKAMGDNYLEMLRKIMAAAPGSGTGGQG
jgi:hypothetical protein